jgi:hypothetical protein
MLMNTFKTLALALVTFTAAGAALADDPTIAAQEPTTSVVSRSEVHQAAARARSAGQIVAGEASFVTAPTGMAPTRAQVIAETLEAIRLGAIERGEQSGVLSAAQLERIRMAGQNALTMTTAGL